MKKIFIAASLFGVALAFCFLPAGCGASYEYPFQNPSLSVEQRAGDIVSRLTLDEKVAQMLNKTPAIERLGIPPYDWWNECLHGVGRTKYKVTVYPQAIGMAAGWDAAAMKQMAAYTAEEGRAVYNASRAKADYSIYHGLTYWTPNINIFRDPRWGRGQETYGEDPFLTATLGKNFVTGLQGDDKTYLKAAACAKHYAVHSGPESSRHTFNVAVSSYDLWDTYLPAFQTLVKEARVAGVMCAYNAFDGQPCCGSNKLMLDILRNEWGFTGYVTSDCGAIDNFYRTHKTHPDAPHAAADAVAHGTDVDCGNEAYRGLLEAVQEGIISESQLDASLQRLFAIRVRLGMFDPPAKAPFSHIDTAALEKAEHKAHALKMARQSLVLLKNDGLLPLEKSKVKTIAVLGANANTPYVQLGNYNGFPTRIITPLDGIREKLPDAEVIYEQAGDLVLDSADVLAVADKVKSADVIIFAGGLSPRIEGEELRVKLPGFFGGDRTSILLPPVQTRLLKALKATGKPVVLVLMNGGAVATPWESENLNAIVEAWYGGEAAGAAIADVLFGDYNPSGHLPVTFYAADNDLPDFEDYSMANRTYKYFKGKTLYPFGYGLSYTDFAYEWAQAPAAEYAQDASIRCAVNIKNIGSKDGDAVAQVYIKYPQTGRMLPLKELCAFERKSLSSGSAYRLEISIPVARLAKWDELSGQLLTPSGEYTIYAGSHSEDEAAVGAFTVLPRS
ncbi:MAG: glycoside hydrolase family 3 C-terminal domain-containing protein [Prevotellaceae bacterium]|jgi:beta-glucosidase|nr:glycoside hydrolase family 3 C-terminal domain-containing protein [Prevotellaceae bacterium]